MAWIAETDTGQETFGTRQEAETLVVYPAQKTGEWVSLRHLNTATGREGTATQWAGGRRIFPPYREDYSNPEYLQKVAACFRKEIP